MLWLARHSLLWLARHALPWLAHDALLAELEAQVQHGCFEGPRNNDPIVALLVAWGASASRVGAAEFARAT